MSWGELGLKALGWLLIAVGALFVLAGIDGSVQSISPHIGTFIVAAVATWGGVKLIGRRAERPSPPAPRLSPPPLPPPPPEPPRR